MASHQQGPGERDREREYRVDIDVRHSCKERAAECVARAVPSDCNSRKQAGKHSQQGIHCGCRTGVVAVVGKRVRPDSQRRSHRGPERDDCRIVSNRRTRRRCKCKRPDRRERGRGDRVDIRDMCADEARDDCAG